MSDSGNATPGGAGQRQDGELAEHLNIKGTDNHNEVFFKIKQNTELRKLMFAFCERQGKDVQSCRFLFDGERVAADDTPHKVSLPCRAPWQCC